MKTRGTAKRGRSNGDPESRISRKRGTRKDPPVNAWPPGVSGNPKGGIRKGMSIAETIRTLKALTPDELRTALKAAGGTGRSGLEQALSTMPKGMPLGLLMHASAIIHSTCEPQPGILTYLRDSDEGKPTERNEISGPNGGAILTEQKVKVIRIVDTPKPLEA
uniref:Uncharacterized protein n=1 Tax=viral metagenome TaxID=1070528 RepID=A0A6M3L8K4_9ZZZZ